MSHKCQEQRLTYKVELINIWPVTQPLVEDFRMQKVGGLLGAFDIWEMAIVQSLLTNSEVWTEMPEKSVEMLEDLQFMFFRLLLDTPFSTPKVALLWETGSQKMKQRVMKRKLNLLRSIKEADDDSLAKEVLEEQIKNKWPGLASECREIYM